MTNFQFAGCVDQVGQIAGDHLVIVGAVAFGLGGLQLLGTILSCLLQRKIRDLTYYA